jgi:16S rRNA (cytidine1402-2'-O)-methyltransferase
MTKRLLEKYEIREKQLSVWNEEHSSVSIKKIFEWLHEGKDIALVTDAGTPGISDPGSRLVSSVREAGFSIVAIPGPSALTAAISVAGISLSDFIFLGFLPHKKGRETLFKEIAVSKHPVIFYESPHRILKTLTSLSRVLSPDRTVTIVRELTKVYEEVISGTAEEVRILFEKNSEKVRGEFVVIVSEK